MVALGKEPAPPGIECPRIPVWHVVISGFTQSLSHPSGAQSLWDALRRARRPRPCGQCDGDSAPVLLFPWDADWAGLAELIWRFRPLDRPTRVFCYAYSWGGGWGFPNLARELRKRGIEVSHAVLCDAVYRPRCRLLSAAALTPWPKILVPDNVREVTWYYQRGGLPAGHEVVAEDPDQTLVNPGVLIHGVTHHYMDDQSEWWLRSLAIASAARPALPYVSPLNVFPS